MSRSAENRSAIRLSCAWDGARGGLRSALSRPRTDQQMNALGGMMSRSLECRPTAWG